MDGVRALAVGLVIAYHLEIEFVRGGFLGVDLFFVLSGFLITTLLLREHVQRGRIDLIAFWLRRGRRLLPALFLLIAVVSAWAAQSSPFERDALRWDILSALAYITNWRFIVAEQSYFQEFAAPSPVQHLWSLAIEEQFYVLWPLLAAGALSLVAARRRGGRAVVVVLVVAIVSSVLALGASYDEFDPSTAYFATHTRAHELLIGALGAVLLDRWALFARVIQRASGHLAAIALAVVLGFAVVITDAAPGYYFGGSLVFSLAAVMLVLSLVVPLREGPTWVSGLLSSQPLPWLGAISYGLYLWHWPVIIWLTPESSGVDGPPLMALRVTLTVMVAAASYWLVEKPIRRGSLGRLHLGVRQVGTGALVGAFLLGALTVATTQGARPIPEFVSNNRKLIVSEVPNATGAVGLVGDSVAMSLYPGMTYEAAAASHVMAAAAFPGCPVGEAERVDRNGAVFPFARRCPDTVVAGQTQLVADFNPSTIFWLSARDRFDIRSGGTILQAGSAEWQEAAFADWDRVLDRLTARGARVVLLLPFHRAGDDPGECDGGAALTSDECTQPILSINALREQYRRWAERHLRDVAVVDPDPALCPASPCPVTLSGVTLFSDRVHLTQEGSLLAAERLLMLVPADLRRDP